MRRRGIFGVLAGALTAGPAATRTALESMGPGLLAPRPLAEAVLDASSSCIPAPDRPWVIADGPLRTLVQAAYSRVNQEREMQGEVRHRIHQGLDPDIAANPSWSPAFKAHVQASRIREEGDTFFALRERLWGH
jgi:hypothetical protein